MIEGDRAADDGGIGRKALLPEAVAEDDRPGAVELALLGGEVATVEERDAQRGKQVVGDADAAQPLRSARACHRQAAVVGKREIGGEGFEASALFAPAVKNVNACRASRKPAAENVLDPDQAGRLAERQRLQEHRIDDAEHGGARPDAKGEGQHGDGGEAGRFRERAAGVTKIVQGEVVSSE